MSITLSLAATGMCLPAATAADHVLVMTISDYPSKPLMGVRYDAGNALALAKGLGYGTQNVTVLKDRQLESDGFRSALQELSQKVQENDRVFVYYSGHGASLRNSRGQCEQALVSRDEKLISMSEVDQAMHQVKDRLPSEVMVVFDSCHSGGMNDMVVNRSAKGGGIQSVTTPSRLASKLWAPKSGESCQNPVNFTKQWTPSGVARGAVNPEANFTFIAAANQREVALDDKDRGGLATTGLLDCLQKGVPDKDGSQSISAMELAVCAQGRIDTEVPRLNAINATKWTPHSIEVTGNQYKSLPAKLIESSTAPQNDASKTRAVFTQIAANSNGNWQVEMEGQPTRVRLGEKARFTYSTQQAGYASMLYVGSDNKELKILLDNVPIAVGKQTWSSSISSPEGENTFLALISQRPLQLEDSLKAAANGAVRINEVVLQNLLCATEATKTRNAGALVADDPCLTQKRNAAMLTEEPQGGVSGYVGRVLSVVGE